VTATRPPHVLTITCHDLGRYLGCYGVASVQTPHLDALAAAGVRFTGAFCTSPGCSPSRAALATGRYPHSNGVLGLAHHPFDWDLAPGEHHVAALLGARGYQTHLFGLQHVAMDVTRLGFDRVYGRGTGRDVAAQVAAFLGGPLPDEPLYVEVNLEEPHRPFDQGGVAPDAARGVSVPPYLPDNAPTREDLSGLQGAIRAADEAVGRIIAALDGAGLADTTLVTFTTDHGIAMPRAKCTLYDTGIETALLLRWPGVMAGAGRVISDMVSNVDFLPTLLAAVGAPAPANLQGRSYLPLLRGDAYTPRDAVYAEKTYHSYYDPMRAIRTARHKFIRNFATTFAVEVPGDVQQGGAFRSEVARYVGSTHPDVELYDLRADPWETHNLAGRPEAAATERDLGARLWAWMAETGDPLLLGPVPSPAYRRAIGTFTAETRRAQRTGREDE
jgi:arylsulfatase A-like enzyme